jgi:hypothetical protein
LASLPAALCAEDSRPVTEFAAQAGAIAEPSVYVKVQFDAKLKPSALKPGDIVEGTLARSVYWRDKQLFPSGSRVRLVVDKQERRRRTLNDHWPWVVKAFVPRHEKYPTFQSAQVFLPDGQEVCLHVSLLSFDHEIQLHAQPQKPNVRRQPGPDAADANSRTLTATKEASRNPRTRLPGLTGSFEAVLDKEQFPPDQLEQSLYSSAGAVTVPPGTQAKTVLLRSISASKSRPGDSFEASLVEPVYGGPGVVLPAGTVFEGRVARSQGPRMLSRSGSVMLLFTALRNPAGEAKPISASVAGVNLDRRSHTRVDPEGRLNGDRPGAAWTLMNLGVTGGLSKAADDGTQLLIEAIFSGATDASTAGTARIVAACVSGVFMLTRRGRDVVLPKYTEMDIVFDRPVLLSAFAPAPVASKENRQTPPIMER